ncbi:cytochrome c [Ferrovibrio sp.]|uniref:c-type cytochrome n=1 Tax=Ferrovibrio sp. TaxID=1917215 RepID=UPI00311D47F2
MAKWHKVFLAAAIGAAIVSTGGYAVAQADVIKARKAGFQMNKDAMAAIKKAVDAGGPATAVVAPAEAIAAWAAKIPAHFPKGSDQGDTKAKADIWAKWSDFEKAAKANEEAAVKLVAAAKAGDMDAVKAGFGAVGASCGGCHKPFRND